MLGSRQWGSHNSCIELWALSGWSRLPQVFWGRSVGCTQMLIHIHYRSRVSNVGTMEGHYLPEIKGWRTGLVLLHKTLLLWALHLRGIFKNQKKFLSVTQPARSDQPLSCSPAMESFIYRVLLRYRYTEQCHPFKCQGNNVKFSKTLWWLIEYRERQQNIVISIEHGCDDHFESPSRLLQRSHASLAQKSSAILLKNASLTIFL